VSEVEVFHRSGEETDLTQETPCELLKFLLSTAQHRRGREVSTEAREREGTEREDLEHESHPLADVLTGRERGGEGAGMEI
jgi:hypothetical protein